MCMASRLPKSHSIIFIQCIIAVIFLEIKVANALFPVESVFLIIIIVLFKNKSPLREILVGVKVYLE